MLTRQLLYTTMTRAMGTFIAVGQHEALKTAVATDKPAQRFTGLTNLLISPVEQLSEIWQSLSNTRNSLVRQHLPLLLLSLLGYNNAN